MLTFCEHLAKAVRLRISCLTLRQFSVCPRAFRIWKLADCVQPQSIPPLYKTTPQLADAGNAKLVQPGFAFKGNVWHTGSGAFLASKGTGFQLGTLSSPAAMIRTGCPAQRGIGLLISHELLTSEFVLRSCKAGAGLRTSVSCQDPRYRVALRCGVSHENGEVASGCSIGLLSIIFDMMNRHGTLSGKHIHAHKHTHTHTHKNTHTHRHTHPHTDTETQTHRHTDTNSDTRTHTNTHRHTHRHKHTHTNTHTHTHTHRHTHSHTHRQKHSHK